MKKYILTTLFILSLMLISSMLFKSDAVAGVNDRYWVGGAGNWSETSHWSTSSGGTPGSAVPTASDSVYFDGASGNCTVDVSANAKTIDFSNYTATLNGLGALNVRGDFTVGINMIWHYQGTIAFYTNSAILTTNGKSLQDTWIALETAGTTLTLADSLNMGTSTFTIFQGTLDLNGKTLNCVFSSNGSGVRAITGSGIINTSSWDTSNTSNLTTSGFTGTLNDTGNFSGGGINLSTSAAVNLTGAGAHALSGTNTFKNFTASGTITGSDSFTVTNDFTVNAGATYSHTGTVTMTAAADTTGAITTNGVTLASPITINAPGGTVTLGSSLNIGSELLSLTAGILDANDLNVTVGRFDSSLTTYIRELWMGNGTWTVSYDNGGGWQGTASWSLVTTNFTLHAEGSTINFTGNRPNFYARNLIYNNVVFTAVSGSEGASIYAGGTIANLTIAGNANNTAMLMISSGNITVTGTLTITGNSTINRLWIQSNTLGTQRTITAASIALDNVDLQDINIVPLESVVNGAFTSDGSSWLPAASTTTSVAGGQSGNGGQVANTIDNEGVSYQSIPTTIGGRYVVSGWFKKGTGNSGGYRIVSSTMAEIVRVDGLSSAGWTYFSSNFTATTASTYVELVSSDAITGHTALFDTVSVKPNTDFSSFSVGGGLTTDATSTNCTGITFPTPTTQTFTHAVNYNWNDSGNWTSRVPLIQDNAIISGNLAGQTITENMRLSPSIDASGVTGSPNITYSQDTYRFGTIYSLAPMIENGTSRAVYFYNRSACTFTPSVSSVHYLRVESTGSSVTLAGNLNTSSWLRIYAGTFSSSTFNITASQLHLGDSATRVINLGSGTHTFNYVGAVLSYTALTNATLSAGTYTLVFNIGSGTPILYLGGLAWNNITLSGAATNYTISETGTVNNLISTTGNVIFANGAKTFNSITLNSNSPQTLSFAAGVTTTLTNFIHIGTGKLTINSSTNGTKANVSKTTGTMPISLKGGYAWDINFTGGTKWVLTNLDTWKTTHPTGGATAPTGVSQYWNPHVINN